MDEHTPGPWEVLEGTDMVQTVGDPYGHGPMHVADMRGWGHMTGRGGGLAWPDDKAIAVQVANARLIAASPELLNALESIKRISNRGGTMEEVMLVARAAIAKASARREAGK